MLRSMFSAISGLRAHQTKMDVTGNNIANVNTVGYKSSTTVFQDTLSQVIRAGGAAVEDRGGTNPAQIGLGVKLASITTNWSQGAAQSTGRSTDFMIEGDGFFVTRQNNEQLFTRAGSFDFDSRGKLVTPNGTILQGWMADANGVVNPNGPIGDLSVPYGQNVAPRASTQGSVGGNLPSLADPGQSMQTATTMFDAQGVPHQVAYTFTKDALPATNQWTVSLTIDGTPTAVAPATLNFNADGSLDDPTPLDPYTVSFTPDPAVFPSWTGPVDVALSGMTQYGSANTVTSGEQNGFAAGSLESFVLANDGTITGVYSNGLRQSIGQLALAAFTNPSGLEKAGNGSFRVGDNSGAAVIGQAGTGGRGVLNSGTLEMSNVDLSEEFTGLIVAQRGFQANSRVISASDEILQDLVNLKR